MADPYLGEVKLWGLNFNPRGWAFCEGQLLAISQYQALYALLGTMFGGDGRTSFGVPELRSRVPVHSNASLRQGLKAGAETVTLTTSEIPSHSHSVAATSADGTTNKPAGGVFAKSSQNSYLNSGNPTGLAPTSVTNTGGNQPHTNEQPTLALNFTIALQGLFPQRS